jgi:hypothetical protein
MSPKSGLISLTCHRCKKGKAGLLSPEGNPETGGRRRACGMRGRSASATTLKSRAIGHADRKATGIGELMNFYMRTRADADLFDLCPRDWVGLAEFRE